MNRSATTLILTLLMASTALAQQPMPGKDMGPGMDLGMKKTMVVPNAKDSPSTAEYKSAMMKMMMDTPNFTGDAVIDFITQMRPHHQATIDMAKVVIASGQDAETKKLARQ
jgi:uncharacterized protein (DUF305 family)